MARRRLVFTACACVAALLAPGCGGGGDSSASDDPPVAVQKTGTGELKLTTHIRLGDDEPILVQLDSGSTGLRIDPSELPAGITPSGPSHTAGFGGDRTLTGRTAMVPITIGSATSRPVAVMVVESVGCGDVSACRSGDGVAGFADLPGIQGIMGIGLDPNGLQGGVFNPLLQMPSPLSSGFTFRLDAGGGSLELGPTPAPAGAVVVEVPASVPLPDGQPGWEDHHLPLCWDVGSASGCGATVLDTGGPSPTIPESFFSGSRLAGTVPSGTPVVLRNAAGDALWSFTTDASPRRVDIERQSGSDQESNAGIGTFLWAAAVGYDVAHGRIWVLPPDA